MKAIEHLQRLLVEVPLRLAALPSDSVERKPSSSKWSPKEELGHLIDSAANNHQRIVRIQLQQNPAMPGYEQDRWVALHHYQQRDWKELIQVWAALNQQLLSAAKNAPESAWKRTCTIADSEPLTLKFVFEDYIQHMIHHLTHIGVEIND